MIDTHTHVIASDAQRYPLQPRSLSGPWYLEAPHTAEELAACMDAAGVAKAVLVQAVGAYSYDNAYAADAAAAYPDRFASACCIDATAADAVATLRFWVCERGMHGVRLFALSREASSWLDDASTFPLWEEAAGLGIHVIVTVFAHQLGELRRVLERFPHVRVSLDHCAFPDAARPAPLLELAKAENLLCKVSSVVLEAAGARAEPFVTALVERFGAERVMWGSDFCQTHDRPYGELVALAERSFAGLSSAERERCFVATPRSVWPSLR